MDLLLANIDKENNRYLRRDIDGGILTEKYEIDRYKLEQYASVVDNLMLGNYNEFGDYEIQPEILSELLSCKKVISDNYENLLFVESLVQVNAFGKLNFVVKVVNSDEIGYKTAILQVLEPIYKAKGYVENTQATTIKKINLPFNDVFKSEVYKAFNIISVEGAGAEKETLEDDKFNEIINRKVRLLYIKKNIEQQDDFMVCYKKNVEELKKTETGKKVLEEYKKEEKVATQYLNIQQDDYKSKNELLTKNIEAVFKALPAPILGNLITLHNKTVDKIKKVKMAMQKQLQPETKSKPKVLLVIKKKPKINVDDDIFAK